MAKIFRNPVRRKNPKTGKEENIFDAKGKQLFHPNWRTVIVTHDGKRKTYTLGSDRAEAQKQADMLDAREREIKNGVRAAPAVEDKNLTRPIEEVYEEYFKWGCARGGKRNMPWDDEFADKKRRNLAFWRIYLDLKTL